MKAEFKCNSRVEFHSTASSDLDGRFGTILGISSAHANNNFWIVLLDTPLPDRLAVVITDACIKLAYTKTADPDGDVIKQHFEVKEANDL
jgi:hypothetical protein